MQRLLRENIFIRTSLNALLNAACGSSDRSRATANLSQLALRF